jgi:hypothetical protein
MFFFQIKIKKHKKVGIIFTFTYYYYNITNKINILLQFLQNNWVKILE